MTKIAYIEDMEQWRLEFSFSIPISIRFSETDMFGHVNNVSPFIYFEEARIEFLKSLGLFASTSNKKAIPIVGDLQCNYLKQMFFNQKIQLYVKVHYVGNSSIDLHYMAIDESEEIALTGRGRLVFVHPESGKPVPLEQSIKEKLTNV
ncbi:thioesterase family protein [Virgibacillus sp. SK37]|uniref:acyl-CoA thioesterase n=1 Tax=Virgibacillus sp. SK37 TaxID=403957 RepID=UPI0004D0DBDD|nr:thioesterase family protein [Virgibacillus sp. SK37]AIF43273.1 hypothetical protein X953_08985 [Virgibacillus sp. SK37]